MCDLKYQKRKRANWVQYSLNSRHSITSCRRWLTRLHSTKAINLIPCMFAPSINRAGPDDKICWTLQRVLYIESQVCKPNSQAKVHIYRLLAYIERPMYAGVTSVALALSSTPTFWLPVLCHQTGLLCEYFADSLWWDCPFAQSMLSGTTSANLRLKPMAHVVHTGWIVAAPIASGMAMRWSMQISRVIEWKYDAGVIKWLKSLGEILRGIAC